MKGLRYHACIFLLSVILMMSLGGCGKMEPTVTEAVNPAETESIPVNIRIHLECMGKKPPFVE